MNDVVSHRIEERIGIVLAQHPPVNALSVAVRRGIAEAIATLDADPAVDAIVLTCAGRTFFAGADISEFGKPPQAPSLRDVIERIEGATKPVVAAIHGTALGGGLELALGCRFRIAVPSARFGLPEVKLGLIPGAGGTQRLPRLIGIARALDIIVLAETVDTDAALAVGLIDVAAAEGSLVEEAKCFAAGAVGQSRDKVRDRPSPVLDSDAVRAFGERYARRFRGLDAPDAAIACVVASAELPFEDGMRLEREHFERLRAGDQSAALRYGFFAERAARRIAGIDPADVTSRPVESVGIVGAGTMGSGIAIAFLAAGSPVTLVEREAAALDRGTGIIRRTIEANATKGRITADEAAAALARLTPALSIDALVECDLVIEAAFELMDVKKSLFAELDRIARPGAILATNTSFLDVDEIAAATARPQDVLGLHFFSPANVMRLLEIVRGAQTAPAVLATALQLAQRIGKVPVVAGVCHGFIGNRILARRRTEVDALILEGATPWAVDRVLQNFGMAMGPFRTSDLAGLDLGWTRAASSGETVRVVLNEMGRHGQKAGAGYYDYDEKGRARPSPVVERAIADFAAKRGIVRRDIGDEEILERSLLPMIDEGVRILTEGIAARASDIDVVWVNGYGWPAWRGGPMYHGERIGLATVVDRLDHYRATHGERFAPSPLLRRLVEQGRGFDDQAAEG